MPAPASIRLKPQVLLEAFMRPGPLAMRQVGGDRIGGFPDSGKTLGGALAHEALNFGNALAVHARRDIDEHDRGEYGTLAGTFRAALREQRRDPAERSTDRDRPLAGAL